MGITFEDSHDLGFVLWCLGSEGINMAEFQKWVLHVIDTVEAPPLYIFNLIDFSGYLTELHRIIGFIPDWSPSDSEFSAISGIAVLRGITPYEPIDTVSCTEALQKNPGIRSKFEEMFPFIRLLGQSDAPPI